MGNLIEFPTPAPIERSDYAGHLMMLDTKQASKFQCFGFLLVARNRIAPVPEEADMTRIAAAVASGILVDITEHPELFALSKPVSGVEESDTGKRVYSGTVQFFQDLGLGEPSEYPDEVVAYATENREEQQRIEEALRTQPRPVAAAKREPTRLITLPPGFDDADRYLLPTP